MKKRGISLIVLVITIIIIIILAGAVILSLSNNNPIENANKAVIMQDMDTFKSELSLSIANKVSSQEIHTMSEVNLSGDAIYEYIPSMEGKKINGQNYSDVLVISNGTLAMNSEATVSEETSVILNQSLNGATASASSGSSNTTSAFVVGDQVKIGTEEFFVIEASPASQSMVTLLAKNKINTETLTQTSPNTISFSETNYWWDNGIKSEYDTANGLNVDLDSMVESDNKYALFAAKQYGSKLGGTGRLLTRPEAVALSSESLLKYTTLYWLATAEGEAIYDENNIISIVNAEGASNFIYNDSTSLGVRPVVTIAKTSVEKIEN